MMNFGQVVRGQQYSKYYKLCKPKVLFLMITTSWAGMYLSPASIPEFFNFCMISLGIFNLAAFGAVLNQYFEDKIDAKMQRTQHRPLVQDELSSRQVSAFAFFLMLSGSFCLIKYANVLTWTLTICGTCGYAFVYTLYLKHQTSQNIVIGGLYGALPPLLGWVALTGEIQAQALLLPLIIFTWTPPHFWALAIEKVEEYRHAQIPMLPVTHGKKFTSFFIVLYNILLFIVCLLPYLIGMFSSFYAMASFSLNCLYLAYNVTIFLEKPGAAMKSFRFSIFYLYALFSVMVLDTIVHSTHP